MLLVLLFVCQVLAAQSRPAIDAGTANLPVQKIGTNDLIGVSVYDAPELTRTVRVSKEGTIRLPMLKRQLTAAGRLPGELEVQIAEGLQAEGILVDPVVTVTVAEYTSRPISVAGAVRKPLTFQALGTVTLLDAISRAEGLNADAGSEILVSRTQQGEDGPLTLVQRIPVRGLIDAADPELNLSLNGGEEIRVPEAGKVFVVGNVRKPGAFRIDESEDTSVLKLLALCEGLMPYAGKEAYIYRRGDGNSAKSEIPIPLKAIISRKSSDVPLQANDILYIPDNSTKRTTMGAIERLITFGSATASGVLVWGAAR